MTYMTIPTNNHEQKYNDNFNEIAPLRKEGFVLTMMRRYLLCHLIVSLSGAYAFAPALPYGLNAFEYLAVLILLFCTLYGIGSWRRSRLLIPYGLVIVFYWGMGLASSPYADQLWKTALGNAVIICTLILSIPAVITDAAALRRFAYAAQLAAIVSLCVCVAEATSPRVAELLSQSGKLDVWALAEHTFRPGGLLRNPNDLATFCIFTFLLSHWCPGFMRQAGRVAAVFGVYLSASRGGAVLFAFCIILYFAGTMRYSTTHRTGSSKSRLIVMALIACMLAFGAYRLIGSQLLSAKYDSGITRMDRILSLTDKTSASARLTSASGRFALLQYWLEKAFDAPLYGEGLYSFQGGKYSPAGRRVRNLGTHNMWIMLLGEVGPLGLLAYLYLAFLGFLRIYSIRGYPMDRLVFMLILIAYMVMSIKGHNQLEHRHWIILMALIQYVPWLKQFGFADSNNIKKSFKEHSEVNQLGYAT